MTAAIVFNAGKHKFVVTNDSKFQLLTAGRERKSEIRRWLDKNASFSRYVSIAHNANVPVTSIAIVKKGESAKKAPGRIDLSAAFSAFCLNRDVQDAILIMQVTPDGMSAAIGVRGGVPFAMSCGDKIYASGMADQYYHLFPSGCVVYGTPELFPGTEVIDLDAAVMLEDLFAGKNPKEIAALKANMTVRYQGLHPLAIAGGVALVLGVIGWYSYGNHIEQIMKERRRAAAIAEEQRNNDPIVVYGRDQEGVYGSMFKTCAKEEIQPPLDDLMGMPLVGPGWIMAEANIVCETDGRRYANVTYARRGGTNDLIAAMFVGRELTFSPDMSTVRISLKQPAFEDGKYPIDPEKIMDVYTFMVDKGTLFQRAKNVLGMEIALTDPAYITGGEPPAGYEGPAYLRGMLTAQGDIRHMMSFLADMNDIVRVSSVKFSEIKQGELPRFSLQGNYYVKKNLSAVAAE